MHVAQSSSFLLKNENRKQMQYKTDPKLRTGYSICFFCFSIQLNCLRRVRKAHSSILRSREKEKKRKRKMRLTDDKTCSLWSREWYPKRIEANPNRIYRIRYVFDMEKETNMDGRGEEVILVGERAAGLLCNPSRRGALKPTQGQQKGWRMHRCVSALLHRQGGKDFVRARGEEIAVDSRSPRYQGWKWVGRTES